MKEPHPSTARRSVSSSKPRPSAASITIDQTHGGWIPPHEPSASWRSFTQRSAAAIARRRAGLGRPGGRDSPGRAPISRSSTFAERTGRRAHTTESGTIVCRAQQAKL